MNILQPKVSNIQQIPPPTEPKLRDIWLAGGCFWGLEAYLDRLRGVVWTQAPTSQPTATPVRATWPRPSPSSERRFWTR